MAREPIAVERVDAAKPVPPPPTVNVAREPLLLPDGTEAPPRIAADVALFVLDDEGVFFSGQRNELTLFNTPATLVWCLLEQDLPVAEITDAYRTAFGLAEADAARHVGTILHQWFGLGYINRPGTSVGEEVPLTTALAQVLTNPEPPVAVQSVSSRRCQRAPRRARGAGSIHSAKPRRTGRAS